MSLLSKSDIQYLQGKKQVSRSYEYKLRSIIKKKVANLMDKEIPLLSSLFPNPDLTEFGKICNDNISDYHLTEISKTTSNMHNNTTISNPNTQKLYKRMGNNQLGRVRSVVRISRRSSEPQTVGSKPIGPVNHTGSNNSLGIIREGDKIIAG